MNAIPRIAIVRSGTGWLVTCHSCRDYERHAPRRPAADLLAHDHQKTCRPKEGRAA